MTNKIKKLFKFTTYDLVEMAMLIALAIILDTRGLKIQIGSNGGSISFTMVPLIILSLRQGPFKGFLGCGLIYGFITCLLDGWGLIYYPFDYLLGYGSLAICGLFSNFVFKDDAKFTFKGVVFLVISIVIASILRLGFATLSGIIFYEYNFVGSLIYNALYISWSVLATVILLIVLYKPLLLINKKVNSRYSY